jgi:hypothetical protein
VSQIFFSFMLFIHFRPISFFIFICFKSRQIYAFVLSLRRCNPRSTSTNRIFLKKSYGSWNDRRHASRVKNPATTMKDKEMDAIDKASWACQETHDGSTTDELVKILLNLTFHSAVTSAIKRFVFLTYITSTQSLHCKCKHRPHPFQKHGKKHRKYLQDR